MLQILLLLGMLIPAIFFLLTQQNTLKVIKPENRFLSPGLVWLQLIPLFGQVWQFFTVVKIAQSISKELMFPEDDSILGVSESALAANGRYPTLANGITYCSTNTAGIILNLVLDKTQTDLLVMPRTCFIAGTIFWIIYWVQLASWKKKLKIVSRDLSFS